MESANKKRKLEIDSETEENLIEDQISSEIEEIVIEDQISSEKSGKLPLDDDEDDNLEEDEYETIENDPFVRHFLNEGIDERILNSLNDKSKKEIVQFRWKSVREMRFIKIVDSQLVELRSEIEKLAIKPNLVRNIPYALKQCKGLINAKDGLTELQIEIFNLITDYRDLFYAERTATKGEEIRLAYCLHALNHVLKTRSLVIHHNAKIKKNNLEADNFRDQGFTRPKVLIIVPFRESALRIVYTLISLLVPESKGNVVNKKRFRNEFCSGDRGEGQKRLSRPDDFFSTFAGNIDDAFRIGISVTKKSLKLYADFYSADIIIGSPLGLRTIIGADGEKNRDFDFLSSIEVLIMDQADIFLMQNWEHILHLFQHLHLQPKEARNVNFSRIRMWSLENLSKHYRQTMVFSAVNVAPIRALFNRQSNYEGKYLTANLEEKGSVSQVVVQMPQMFHRFNPSSVADSPDERFAFFITKILPHFKDDVNSHTLIFIPSYFDFVRIRNYFKREDLSFNQISEYAKDGKVARARDMFFHGQNHFLLYTERFHFYHRYVIKGARHVIFYELPTYPSFYSEIANLLQPHLGAKKEGLTNESVAVIYSRFDAQQLAAVVGHARASQMIQSPKKLHMFVTDKL